MILFRTKYIRLPPCKPQICESANTPPTLFYNRAMALWIRRRLQKQNSASVEEYEPANVLAQDGNVVGNDERAEYTRSTPIGGPTDRTI